MGLGMIAAGTATGAPIAMATKQAMTLESAMADVRKVTNMVPAQIEQMSNDFIDMSENIPMAANELAQIAAAAGAAGVGMDRSEEHTSELQSLMRISYAVFCLKKKKQEE